MASRCFQVDPCVQGRLKDDLLKNYTEEYRVTNFTRPKDSFVIKRTA